MIKATITTAQLEPNEIDVIYKMATKLECPHVQCKHCGLYVDSQCECIIDLANFILAKYDRARGCEYENN